MHTDFEKLMTWWINTSPNDFTFQWEFFHVHTDLEMMMTLWTKKCPNRLCYESRHVPNLYAWMRTVSIGLQIQWRWCRYESRHVPSAEKKANILKNNVLLSHLISYLCNVHVLFPNQTLGNSIFCILNISPSWWKCQSSQRKIAILCEHFSIQAMEVFKPLMSSIYEITVST